MGAASPHFHQDTQPRLGANPPCTLEMFGSAPTLPDVSVCNLPRPQPPVHVAEAFWGWACKDQLGLLRSGLGGTWLHWRAGVGDPSPGSDLPACSCWQQLPEFPGGPVPASPPLLLPGNPWLCPCPVGVSHRDNCPLRLLGTPGGGAGTGPGFLPHPTALSCLGGG